MPDESNPPPSEVPLPGMVDPAASQPVPNPDSGSGEPLGKSKRGGARPGAGRKSREEKLAEELARRGCLPAATPAAVAVPPAAPSAPPFDADGAATFFQTVLDAADEINAEHVAALVEKALKDKSLAESFKAKAALAPAMKKLAVADLVKLCQTNNVSIGPGAGLLAAGIQIVAQQMALRKEIKALAAAAPKETKA